MKTAAIIVAAGAGLRAGGELPKQYQTIGGQMVLRHTVEAFISHPDVELVLVVIGKGHDEPYFGAVDGLDLLPPVTGGSTRQASVFNGLEALADHGPDAVLIHDAARPFVTQSVISHMIAGLDRHDGIIPGLPVADTLKRAVHGEITETVPRDHLWAAQTPQAFRYSKIHDAHARAKAENVQDLTDDASVAEWAGLAVQIIAGDSMNRKLTTAQDISDADTHLRTSRIMALSDIRVGQGYDVHAFEDGDHVILCGVKIPHDKSLKGHSDADVSMHALTDAILGALSEGDIGAHFPPSDPQWRAADSAIFLKAAGELVTGRGGMLAHCDVTIVCEKPKLRPYIDAMRERLADILSIAVDRVSVKATTSEQLGFTGRQEGIAAHATATVRLPFVE